MTKILLSGFAVLLLHGYPCLTHAQENWRFEEISGELDLDWSFELSQSQLDGRDIMSGGLAAADIDQDGWVDLYIPRGDARPGLLLLNLGDGRFRDVAEEWRIQVSSETPMSYAIGASFADVDGNGFPDLVLGGVRGFGLRLYLNEGSRFRRAGPEWGLDNDPQDQYSVAFGDIDGDARLDMAVGHWNGARPAPGSLGGHLWRNAGGRFEDISGPAGIAEAFTGEDFSFTPNFADVTGDGRPDLLIAADFNTSQIFHNAGDGRFINATTPIISDKNGMGAAIGDVNGDGHLDWFVTAIWSSLHEVDPGSDFSGNRLYLNDGEGFMRDGTELAGVRRGGWGWGSCAADFDNSGDVDLFHVNGFLSQVDQPSRLFLNDGAARFVERAETRGIADDGQGRGVVCFDFDRDGDIDVFIQNNAQSGRVYRNSAGDNGNHWLGLRLRTYSANTAAIGAKVKVTAGGLTQVREMRIPNQYLSTGPAEIHLGLGEAPLAERIEIVWPDGQVEVHLDISADQWLTARQGCSVIDRNNPYSRLVAMMQRDCMLGDSDRRRLRERIRNELGIVAGDVSLDD